MASFFRFLLGGLLLPLCWAFARSLVDAILSVTGSASGISAESIALLGGIVAFAMSWTALSHPVKAYVLGHELTHALWALMFGAMPSDVKVTENGGSVKLTKSNFLITLAPYFFPFYTFVVIIAAIITYAFLRPLPFLPLWMFLIGFTWAFHVLFTIETLMVRQPDVKLYGRLFSWTIIFIVNVAIILVWLATTTEFTFAELVQSIVYRSLDAYVGTIKAVYSLAQWLWYNTAYEINR